MNFAEVLSKVLEITKRPDKTDRTVIAINRAVSLCTLLGDFDRDNVEVTFNISSTLYGDTISIASLPRFRKFNYIKPTGSLYYLNYLAGDKIFTPGGGTQRNKYYLTGTDMTYLLSSLSPTLELSYATYPIELDAVTNTAHWMLDEMPYAIIDLAASDIFKQIGDDASSKRHQAEGMDFFKAVRNDKALST